MEQVLVETGVFNHREVKPHFVNPCCFGEDFAAWLRGQLGALAEAGFEIGEPIQEDYGWGFWLTRGRNSFWLAISFCGDGPTEPPAQWVISVAHDAGLNPLRRLWHRPDVGSVAAIKQVVWTVLDEHPDIRVLGDPDAV